MGILLESVVRGSAAWEPGYLETTLEASRAGKLMATAMARTLDVLGFYGSKLPPSAPASESAISDFLRRYDTAHKEVNRTNWSNSDHRAAVKDILLTLQVQVDELNKFEEKVCRNNMNVSFPSNVTDSLQQRTNKFDLYLSGLSRNARYRHYAPANEPRSSTSHQRF